MVFYMPYSPSAYNYIVASVRGQASVLDFQEFDEAI